MTKLFWEPWFLHKGRKIQCGIDLSAIVVPFHTLCYDSIPPPLFDHQQFPACLSPLMSCLCCNSMLVFTLHLTFFFDLYSWLIVYQVSCISFLNFYLRHGILSNGFFLSWHFSVPLLWCFFSVASSTNVRLIRVLFFHLRFFISRLKTIPVFSLVVQECLWNIVCIAFFLWI